MTIYNIGRRLDKLEQQVGVGKTSSIDMLLQLVQECGYELVAKEFCRDGEPFYMTLEIMDDTGAHHQKRDHFVFERFRGLVPDEEIRKAYSFRRYWYNNEGVGLKVRQLAGVVDEAGNVMPGYQLCSNGCIVDAPRIIDCLESKA